MSFQSYWSQLLGPSPPSKVGDAARYRFKDVAEFWAVFCICYWRFDRWAFGGSGAATSGHLRPIVGGPGGPGRN